MEKSYHILLIDDHPITVEAYKGALELMSTNYKFVVSQAYDIDSALNCIKIQPDILPFDIAFVDVGLPHGQDSKIISGEGLVAKLRAKFPKIKIVIPTLYIQAERLHYILEQAAPEALLLKTDFRTKDIIQAIESVLQNETYFSSGVKKILETKKLKLDSNDLKLLSCLSKGIKIKDMDQYIPLALRTIEERKNKLMILFDVHNNEQLLKIAREKGLI